MKHGYYKNAFGFHHFVYHETWKNNFLYGITKCFEHSILFEIRTWKNSNLHGVIIYIDNEQKTNI